MTWFYEIGVRIISKSQVPRSRLLGNWEFLPYTGLNLRLASQLAQKP
jgi:hypothetical protein